MRTSPSAVLAKCSAQVECKGGEGEEEEAAGSSAKRRKREESHMTGEGFSNQQLVLPLVQSTHMTSFHSLTSSWSTRTVHTHSEYTYWIGSCVFRRLVW